MSLRAIKKRDSPLNSSTTPGRHSLFRKYSTCNQLRRPRNNSHPLRRSCAVNLSSIRNLESQRRLLGRSVRSNPDLRRLSTSLDEFSAARLVYTKSEGDVHNLCKGRSSGTSDGSASSGVLTGAKSEIFLQTIASHTYNFDSDPNQSKDHSPPETSSKMMSSARSHRDLMKSNFEVSSTQRRMSECSISSSYSERTSAISSAPTLSSATASDRTGGVRVPIIGYEVMEERARFTVFKLRVENPLSNDCWLVLRRYTDFVRLNAKLKQTYPHVTLQLPRKKIFGDNFNSVFLDNRVQGLQMFVNAIMAREELRKCKMVREFFCLDEPPSYSESMEECRAIFEAQEETIAHLKLQISNKNDFILNLQQRLREGLTEKEQLRKALEDLKFNCGQGPRSANGLEPTP